MTEQQHLLGSVGGPVHTINRRRGAPERQSVLKSSLDIVFSYSRSQQLYLQSHLPSVPSFIDSPFPPSQGSSRRSSIDPYGNSRARVRPRPRRPRRDLEEGTPIGGEGEGEVEVEGETETGTEDDDESRVSDDYDEEDEDEYYAQPVDDGDDEEDRTSRSHTRRNSSNQQRHVPPQIVGEHSPSPSPSRSRSGGRGGKGGTASPSPLRNKQSKVPIGRIPVSTSTLSKSTTAQEYGSMGKRPVTSSTPFDNPIPFPPTSHPQPRPDDSIASVPATPSSFVEPLRKRSMVSLSVAPNMLSGLRRSGQPGASGWSRSSVGGIGGGRKRRRSSVASNRSVMMGMELGRSTNGQTLFNAIAVLVGIGILSEPLAFAYAGWIGGTLLLIFFGFFTNYTAKLLAKIILADPNCRGYSDLGVKAFGWKARLFVDVLFCLELFALSIAWIVLFGDSLYSVLGGLSANTYKLIGFFIIVPTTLLPLHLLSIPSIMSLVSSFVVIVILLVDGFSKKTAPGSIVNPVPTSLGPDWTNGNVLGGLGLLIAGFGGHAIIPSLAIDMKEPQKFNKMINIAYLVASVVFFIAGAAGYLMFGNKVSDEITKDLMLPRYGFSKTLNQVATWMIVVNPVTKFALCTRPLNLTVETIFSLNPSPPPLSTSDPKPIEPTTDLSSQFTIRTTGAFSVLPIPASAPPSYVRAERNKTIWRVLARAGVTAACVAVAILLPGFGRLMAFLGSFTTFFICAILPIMFYTALTPREERGRTRDIIHAILFTICGAMMIAGTAWAVVTGDREVEGWS